MKNIKKIFSSNNFLIILSVLFVYSPVVLSYPVSTGKLINPILVGTLDARNGTVLLGSVTSADPANYSNATGITAYAGGGQSSATALTEEINNVTTVATAGDSVKLPVAVAGKHAYIKNSGATALDIFPASSDSIDALAVNLAIRIQPGSSVNLYCKDAIVWESDKDVSLTINAPSTVKGQLEIKAADSSGNTVTTIVNASQAAARTYTIPDAGANASFVMTAGAQTLAGVKTFSSAPLVPNITAHGITPLTQVAPDAISGVSTLTIANLLKKIVTFSGAAGATMALTLPLGSDIETGIGSSMAADDSFDFSIINTDTDVLDTATLTANTGVTIVGNAVIQSNHASSTQPSSVLFTCRKTATNTYVVYRIAG